MNTAAADGSSIFAVVIFIFTFNVVNEVQVLCLKREDENVKASIVWLVGWLVVIYCLQTPFQHCRQSLTKYSQTFHLILSFYFIFFSSFAGHFR